MPKDKTNPEAMLDCSGLDLSHIDLRGRELSAIDLHETVLVEANLYGTNLYGADLTGADLTGADLTRADLRHAKLLEADLEGAKLTGVYLEGANLSWTDLSGADLSGAHFSGVDLRSTSGMTQRQADNAISDKYTKWPAGLVWTFAPTTTRGPTLSVLARWVMIHGGFTEDCRGREYGDQGFRRTCRIVDSFPDPAIAGKIAICEANYSACGPIKVMDRYFNFTWDTKDVEPGTYVTIYP
jgi:hypothetical protein